MRSSRQGTFPPGNRPQGPAPPGGVGSVAFFRRNHRRGSMGWHACGQGDGLFPMRPGAGVNRIADSERWRSAQRSQREYRSGR